MMSSNLELARHLLLTAASDDARLGSACGRPPKVRHGGSSPSGCGGASKVQYYSRLRSHGARKKAFFVVTLGNVLSYDFETFFMYSREELSGFSPSQSILRSVDLFASFLSVTMTNIRSFTAIKDVCGTAHLLLVFLSIALSLSLAIVPFPFRRVLSFQARGGGSYLPLRSNARSPSSGAGAGRSKRMAWLSRCFVQSRYYSWECISGL